MDDNNTNTFTLHLEQPEGAMPPSEQDYSGMPFEATQPAPLDIQHQDFSDMMALPTEAEEMNQYSNMQYQASDVVAVSAGPKVDSNLKPIILGTLLIFGAFLGYIAWEGMEAGKDPVDAILEYLGLQEEALPEEPMELAEPVKYAKEVPVNENVGQVPENPYWELPNVLPKELKVQGRQWSQEEESLWKASMLNQFNYQRYKTVKDVRRYRLAGSEVILYDALKEKKLWTRMSALAGLAEFGVPVDIDAVEEAIGDERPNLVSNYFKRFERRKTIGEIYILRQAIRVVDSRSRYNIVRSLASGMDSLSHLYLVAASLDPGYKIAGYARMQLARSGVSKGQYDTYKSYITGLKSYPASFKMAEVKDVTQAIDESEKLDESTFVKKVEYFGDVKMENVDEEGLVDDGFEDLDTIEVEQ